MFRKLYYETAYNQVQELAEYNLIKSKWPSIIKYPPSKLYSISSSVVMPPISFEYPNRIDMLGLKYVLLF